MALSKIQGAQIQTPVDISTVNITGVGTITNGSITNLTGTAGTVTTLRSTTLNADTGNIVTGVTTNFTSTNGSITNLTGTAGTVTTLRSTTLNADTGNIVTGVTTNFTSTNATITNLTGTAGTVTTLRSTTGNFTTGNIVTGVTTNFTSTNVVITGVTTVSAGTVSLPSISPSGDSNTGIFFPAADTLAAVTAGSNRLHITSGGLVGIGSITPSATLQVDASGGGTIRILRSSAGANYVQFEHDGTNGTITSSGATGNLLFNVNSGERGRLDTSGRLLIGTSSVINNAYGGTSGLFQVSKDDFLPIGFFSFTSNPADGYCPYLELNRARGTKASPTIVSSGDELGEINFYGYDGSTFRRGASIRSYVDAAPGSDDMPSRLTFYTSADGSATPTERMRIDTSGRILIATTNTNPAENNVNGAVFGSDGRLFISTTANEVIRVNRKTNDGTLIFFHQDGTEEGSISVSGATVSYNGAHLSRWSQLPSGAERIEILRGSVLSNLDEMCEWGDEENEQLNRMKVSTVEGDKNVSGVFQCWDDDDDTYINDFYCAMTGDFIIRIADGVTVERGDLLMSAGNGTAKPQGDGYVQDKTIAKVTSTNVSCTYEDGSYCVPCVLMAC